MMGALIDTTVYAPCPDHDGRWFHKSGGACDCGGSHSLLDPAVGRRAAADAHARQIAADLDAMLDRERTRWHAAGCPAECVRPAGEAFGWRHGSGPCDCPPCLAASAAAHVPMTDAGPTV